MEKTIRRDVDFSGAMFEDNSDQERTPWRMIGCKDGGTNRCRMRSHGGTLPLASTDHDIRITLSVSPTPDGEPVGVTSPA